jgi:phosphotriesterase-related protein
MQTAGHVQTVLGPVAPEELGHALPHEHLLVDAVGSRGTFVEEAGDRGRWLEPITLANVYEARRNWHFFRDNIQLLSVTDAIEASNAYRAAGGGTIVDVTPRGLGRDARGLARISRASGVHVVMGSGYYVVEYHPPQLADMSEQAIEEELLEEIANGVGDTGIKPGVIGEIGLSWPVRPVEERVLRAAARASARSGLALTIHPGRNPDAPLDAIRIVREAGGHPERTIVDHLDRTITGVEAFRAVAATGCYLEMDLFGLESSYYPWSDIDLPNDGTRVDYLVAMAHDGYADRMLVSHDVDMKVRLGRYGGEGYEHIIEHVVPIMRAKGLSEEEIALITRENPARILTVVTP